MAKEKTALMKVRVLGDEGEAALGGIVPNGLVVGLTQTDLSHVLRVGILLSKRVHEPVRQVLIEEQLHCEGSETSLRSRSAANSRQARRSSRVRSGKSLRMSASLMPEA